MVGRLGAREGEAKATVQEPGSQGTEQVQAASEAFGPDGGCQSLKQSALLLFFFFFNLAHVNSPPSSDGLSSSSSSLCLTDQRSTKRGKHTQSKIKIPTPPARQNKLEQTNYSESTQTGKHLWLSGLLEPVAASHTTTVFTAGSCQPLAATRPLPTTPSEFHRSARASVLSACFKAAAGGFIMMYSRY